MSVHRKSVEFETTLDQSGKITIPENVSREFGKGNNIHVRLTAKVVSSELKARNVSEDEIERIGSIQLESRDQVIRFLLSEGVLKKSAERKQKPR
jgi:hypothetical protein